MNAQLGEVSDDGLANSDTMPDARRKDSTPPRSGDGVVAPAQGEECDFGDANGAGSECGADCLASVATQCRCDAVRVPCAVVWAN